MEDAHSAARPAGGRVSTEPAALLTDAVRAMIGVRGPELVAPYPLNEDSLRRFTQALMINDRLHWDSGYARASRYGDLVAPPLWPSHAHVRPAGTPDPLDALALDADWDGLGPAAIGGLPPLPGPARRALNGGVEAELFALARVGDRVVSQSRYTDISERSGRSGPMLLVRIETGHSTVGGTRLAIITSTLILR
jgi:hydroxyacyl-ACP dehydratase HTD2-like protein with hotdog domain